MPPPHMLRRPAWIAALAHAICVRVAPGRDRLTVCVFVCVFAGRYGLSPFSSVRRGKRSGSFECAHLKCEKLMFASEYCGYFVFTVPHTHTFFVMLYAMHDRTSLVTGSH